MASSATGATAVVWGARDGGEGASVEIATRPPGGSFSAVERIASVPAGTPAPQVALDAVSEATVAWTSYSAAVGNEVVVASGPLSTPAASTTVLAYPARSPSLAVNANGAAVLGYIEERGGSAVAGGSYRPAGGGFGAGTALSSAESAVDAEAPGERPPVLTGIAAEGDALAAFAYAGGGSPPQVALFDAAGPVLNGLSIPAHGVVGSPVSFSVAPASGVSTIASTTWSFSDGGSAPGAVTSHVFAAPGSYVATVTSVDAVGNASTATGSIAIARPTQTTRLIRRRYSGARLLTHVARATREGTFRLGVRCIAYTDCSRGSVHLTAVLSRGGSGKGVARLGKDKFKAASHARASVSFRLTRRLLTLLRSRGHLPLHAVVETGDLRGQHATTRTDVRLEAPLQKRLQRRSTRGRRNALGARVQ